MPYLCGFLFVVFTSCYLWLFQSDYLAQLQSILSKGVTSYNPYVGTILIVFLLTMLSAILQSVMSLPIRFIAMAWVPATFLLSLLTCWHFDTIRPNMGSQNIVLISIISIVYIVVLLICLKYPDASSERSSITNYLSSNILILSLAFLATGMIGNSTVKFHHESLMAQYIKSGEYEKALQVGKYDTETTPMMSAMRCYALSCTGNIGSELFSYPIHGSRDLLPLYLDTTRVNDCTKQIYDSFESPTYFSRISDARKFLEHVCRLDSNSHTPALDYLLCAYLLDRDLKDFSEKIFERKDSLEMPVHYREAAVLNAALLHDTFSFYADSIMALSFLTFDSLRLNEPNFENLRSGKYKHTYWYYYFFGQ